MEEENHRGVYTALDTNEKEETGHDFLDQDKILKVFLKNNRFSLLCLAIAIAIIFVSHLTLTTILNTSFFVFKCKITNRY